MLDDERRRREILYREKKSRADDELQRPLGNAEQRQESRHAQKELYDSIALIPARHGEHVREMEAGEQQHRGDGKGLRLKALDEPEDADQHQVKRQSGGIDPDAVRGYARRHRSQHQKERHVDALLAQRGNREFREERDADDRGHQDAETQQARRCGRARHGRFGPRRGAARRGHQG